MKIDGLHGLLKDLEFAFVLPIVVFVLVRVNVKLSRPSRSDGVKLRLGILFSILLFVISLSILSYQDKDVLAAVWRTSPALYSTVFAVSVIVIASVLGFLFYSYLRPSLWSLGRTKANA